MNMVYRFSLEGGRFNLQNCYKLTSTNEKMLVYSNDLWCFWSHKNQNIQRQTMIWFKLLPYLNENSLLKQYWNDKRLLKLQITQPNLLKRPIFNIFLNGQNRTFGCFYNAPNRKCDKIEWIRYEHVKDISTNCRCLDFWAKIW